MKQRSNPDPKHASAPMAHECETPVRKAYRDWFQFTQSTQRLSSACTTDAEVDAIADRLDAHVSKVLTAPSRCNQDVILKFLTAVADNELFYGMPMLESIEAEARAFIAGAGNQHVRSVLIPRTRQARLEYIAEVTGVDAPEDLSPSLTDEDDAPSQEVLHFAEKTGASLDFIYFGDTRPMIRARFNQRTQELQQNGEAA